MDNIPAPLLNCFICGDPEMPARKLLQVTPKGYTTLLAYAEAVGDATVLERMKEAWTVGRLRYHFKCRCDLYNKSVKATMNSTRKYNLIY